LILEQAGGYAWLAALFGLLIGSFLNVVIYRLPKMMERGWQAELAQYGGQEVPASEPFNLMRPNSRCGACGHAIAWHENIPILSYVLLKGRCSACGHAFGLRYLVVELVTAALAYYCAQRFGITWPALLWFGFCAALLTLALIDWDTTLLPDDITLPLLWAGLIAAALELNPLVPLWHAALWGAVAGYLSLWLVYWLFKLATGKEGMGYGDFKLFAALGAWLGWQALVPVILMASVIGVVVGVALKINSKLREGRYVPFGPFLAAAGLTALFFGHQSILKIVGF
jgi:leader peptidase (prepilin peptidase) / N-methyltransferase